MNLATITGSVPAASRRLVLAPTRCQLDEWNLAASKAGADVRQWAAGILDSAASASRNMEQAELARDREAFAKYAAGKCASFEDFARAQRYREQHPLADAAERDKDAKAFAKAMACLPMTPEETRRADRVLKARIRGAILGDDLTRLPFIKRGV